MGCASSTPEPDRAPGAIPGRVVIIAENGALGVATEHAGIRTTSSDEATSGVALEYLDTFLEKHAGVENIDDLKVSVMNQTKDPHTPTTMGCASSTPEPDRAPGAIPGRVVINAENGGLGVALEYLDTFIEMHGGEEKMADMKIYDLKDANLPLMSQTTEFKESYCEWLQRKNPSQVSKATVFISYAWEYTFVNLASAIKNHFNGQAGVFIWLDVFCANQHTKITDFNSWATIFRSNLQAIDYTVLILNPWENPIPFTRVWCLFEIFISLSLKCKFDIAISNYEISKMILDASEDSMNSMIAKIDVERSNAKELADKDMIFAMIRAEGGFRAVNLAVFDALRSWRMKVADRLSAEGSDDYHMLNSLAVLYKSQGRYAQADPLFVRCLELSRVKRGEDHPDTLATMNGLAILYYSQGRYADAEALHVKCLELRRKKLGDDHPDTLRSMNNLARLYYSQGRYADAEPLYMKCLELYRVKLGDNHPDTLCIMGNLASLYYSQGRYEDAEPLYVKCLELRRVKLGDDHPDTLSSMNNLAGLYDSQGRYEDAEPLYVKCLEFSRVKLGDDHPDTLDSMNNLAELYYYQGRYADGEPLFVKCLEVRRVKLGDDHPSTLTSMNNLALLYYSQGRYEDAEALYVKCLEVKRVKLGDDHPDTLQSMNNLALLYYSQGRYADAEPLYVKCLEVKRVKLGDDHPDTLGTMNCLATLYQSQGRYADSEPLHVKCLELSRVKLGDDHPSTLTSMNNLAALYKTQGRFADAEALYVK